MTVFNAVSYYGKIAIDLIDRMGVENELVREALTSIEEHLTLDMEDVVEDGISDAGRTARDVAVYVREVKEHMAGIPKQTGMAKIGIERAIEMKRNPLWVREERREKMAEEEQDIPK